MVYYIPDFHITGIGYNALNKSRDDLMKIYKRLGFEMLGNNDIVLNDEKVKYFASNMDILGGYVDALLNEMEQKLKPGDYMIMDFPFAIKFSGYSKIVSYANSKKVKVIFFVHDLDGVRFQNPFLNWTDSSCLDMAYYLITASKRMDTILYEQMKVSKEVKSVNHDFWDYILDKEIVNNKENALICFAGNLGKSDFIKEIPDALVEQGFNCYGKGFGDGYKGAYKGEYPPEELVAELDGLFGLVWDGKTASTCGGNFGKYLRINTSHKFGLYLASGKPVIVWSEGSIAEYVLKNSIGIAVSSLNEIPYRLSSIDYRAYKMMKENVMRIRKEVITGDHLAKVILSTMD